MSILQQPVVFAAASTDHSLLVGAFVITGATLALGLALGAGIRKMRKRKQTCSPPSLAPVENLPRVPTGIKADL